ncbi:hypothetical protein A6A04_03715 [Paramagnetospirillum marisnigri]|uniref:O-antigen ligase-related domain-containing protein n=2 Tax=Paramagnetospirillum marisnigri TaxID=1285242 RepID=A0A178MKG4_9PROT|nr:hypothetical protein A6A04_03715 [Paramagnetospirillum marisnigri]
MENVKQVIPAPLLVGAAPFVALFAFRGTIILLILIALLGLWGLFQKQWCFPSSRGWLAWTAALLIWCVASAVWASTPGLALPKSAELLGLGLAGCLGLGYFRALDGAAADRILLAMIFGLISCAVIALSDHMDGMMVSRLLHAMVGKPIAQGHAFSAPKASATLAAIWAVLCVGACWMRGWYRRAGLVLVSAFVIIWVTNSNTGLVAAVVGFVALAVAWWFPRAVRMILASCLVIGFAVGGLASSIPNTWDIAQKIRQIPPSGLHRLAIWQFTGQRIDERPLLGWGLDSSRALPGGEDDIPVTLKFVDEPREEATNCKPGRVCVMQLQALPLHPHNFVLQVWVELGAVGAFLFCGMVVAILRARGGADPGTSTALAVIATSAMVAMAGYGIWQIWWLSALWLSALVAVAVLQPPYAKAC